MAFFTKTSHFNPEDPKHERVSSGNMLITSTISWWGYEWSVLILIHGSTCRGLSSFAKTYTWIFWSLFRHHEFALPRNYHYSESPKGDLLKRGLSRMPNCLVLVVPTLTAPLWPKVRCKFSKVFYQSDFRFSTFMDWKFLAIQLDINLKLLWIENSLPFKWILILKFVWIENSLPFKRIFVLNLLWIENYLPFKWIFNSKLLRINNSLPFKCMRFSRKRPFVHTFFQLRLNDWASKWSWGLTRFGPQVVSKFGKNAIMFGSPDLRRNQAWIRGSAMQKERKSPKTFSRNKWWFFRLNLTPWWWIR